MIKYNTHKDDSLKPLLSLIDRFPLQTPTLTKKNQPLIPPQQFHSDFLTLLSNYTKSKSQSFTHYILDYFSYLSDDTKKNNKLFSKFVCSWKHIVPSNQQISLYFKFLDNKFGTKNLVSEYLRIRKEILKYSIQKQIQKVSLDYQNILHVINRLYSSNTVVLISKNIKNQYQNSKAPFRCDTKAISLMSIMLETLALQFKKSKPKNLLQDMQSNTLSLEFQETDDIQLYDSGNSNDEQNSLSLDRIQSMAPKHIQGSTLNSYGSINHDEIPQDTQSRNRLNILFQQELEQERQRLRIQQYEQYQYQVRQEFKQKIRNYDQFVQRQLIYSIKEQTQISEDEQSYIWKKGSRGKEIKYF